MFPGSSPITSPGLLRKYTRSKGPSLPRHYSASSLLRPSPPHRLAAVPTHNVGVATSTRPEFPPATQTTLPACRAPYPGGPQQGRLSVASLSARPSPFVRRVGIPDFTFESYHSRYGLLGCSPTIRGLYHEAPTYPVDKRLGRSQATKCYRQLLGWVLPPLVICAFGAALTNLG